MLLLWWQVKMTPVAGIGVLALRATSKWMVEWFLLSAHCIACTTNLVLLRLLHWNGLSWYKHSGKKTQNACASFFRNDKFNILCFFSFWKPLCTYLSLIRVYKKDVLSRWICSFCMIGNGLKCYLWLYVPKCNSRRALVVLILQFEEHRLLFKGMKQSRYLVCCFWCIPCKADIYKVFPL